MKLLATIAESEAAVKIDDEGGRVLAEVDGRKYEVTVQETKAGVYLLMAEGRVFDCRVERRPASGEPVGVLVGPTRYEITLTDPRRLRGASSRGVKTDGAAGILAQMPGKVVRVLVAAGDTVEVGTGVVVVEAMKMQNELKSPKAGVVAALNVEAGATVNAGDVLAIVE